MNPFKFSYAAQVNHPIKKIIVHIIEFLSGKSQLEKLYVQNTQSPIAGESFWCAAVRLLRLDVRCNTDNLKQIPKTGPLVIIANHPYGVLDGISILYLIEQVRPDFKILASSVLTTTPEIIPVVISIDLSTRQSAPKNNVLARQAALDFVLNGGCLIIFPAGLISTSPDLWGKQKALDPKWGTFSAKIIKRANATVVPIFFHGQNSPLFHFVSRFSRTFRLALIFSEVKRRMGTSLHATIGEPIFANALKNKNNPAIISTLRKATYALENVIINDDE